VCGRPVHAARAKDSRTKTQRHKGSAPDEPAGRHVLANVVTCAGGRRWRCTRQGMFWGMLLQPPSKMRRCLTFVAAQPRRHSRSLATFLQTSLRAAAPRRRSRSPRSYERSHGRMPGLWPRFCERGHGGRKRQTRSCERGYLGFDVLSATRWKSLRRPDLIPLRYPRRGPGSGRR
jgi:hypothetical protein